MIKIEHLCKSYGEVKAVQDISFAVKQGELFAFLGQNGAGKSTTISIMCGRLPKDSGRVVIGGSDIDTSLEKVKQDIGVVFQDSVLDKPLTVKENLKTRAALYGIYGPEFERRFAELSDTLELSEFAGRRYGKLSGGQRRRADIARALLHQPALLILDEPTTGLDPQSRKAVWNVVSRMQRESGLTVLLTTHYMEEAADADHVVILDSGKIAAEGTPVELKNRYTGDYITLYGADEAEVKKLGKPYEPVVGGYRAEVKNTEEATSLIIKYPDIFRDYEITKGKMDDVFLSVTGKRLIDAAEADSTHGKK